MNKKLIIPAGLVVVLVIVAGVLATRGGDSSATQNNQSSGNSAATIAEEKADTTPVATATQNPPPAAVQANPPPAEIPAKGTFSDEEEIQGSDLQVFEIVFDGDQYTPPTLSAKAGDIVIFKNASKNPFWPASNPHPLHSDYPEFDPKKPIPAGETFEFKFTKVGTWKFHDHLSPTARGTIVVK